MAKKKEISALVGAEGKTEGALGTSEDGFPAFLEPEEESEPDRAEMAQEEQPKGRTPELSDEGNFAATTPPPCGRCLIVLEQRIALGNGTLEAGTVLGEAERDGGAWILEETAECAEGISEVELRNALRNPHILKLE